MQANKIRGCLSKQKQNTSGEILSSPQPSGSLRRDSEIIQNDPECNHQRTHKKFDIPGDGNCLFWSVTLAYLIPVKDDDVVFEKRYKDLFGNDKNVIANLERIRTSIRNFNPLSHSVPKDDEFENLVKNTFRNRVVDFMERNLDKFKCFPEVADKQYRINLRNSNTLCKDSEMHAISLILNCKLYVDGQCFPVLSHDEEISKDHEKTVLVIFRMKHSCDDLQNVDKYCFKLQKSLIMTYRETLINNIFKWLEKCSDEKTGTHRQEHIHSDHCSSEYNSINIAKKCEKSFHKTKCDIEKIVCRKSKCRNNQELLEVNELGIFLEDYQLKRNLSKKSISENNVQNMYNLFKNPKHVADILDALKQLPNNDELFKGAFKLLKHAIDELYSNKSYDLVLEIFNVKEVKCLKDNFLKKDSSYLDSLQVLRIVALTKIKKHCREDAMEILNYINDRIKTSSELGKSTDDADKFHFSLLISSDIAYTKHIMGQCEESFKEYKELHDKIIRHIGIHSDVSRLSCEIYNEILQSEKYSAIMSLNNEFLTILHIRGDIAHELTCIAVRKQKYFLRQLSPNNKCEFDEVFDEVLQHYTDALNLYEEIFEIERFDAETADIKKTMNDIAFVNNKLADLKASGRTNTARLSEALSHLNKALRMGFLVLRVDENDCPVNSKDAQVIKTALKRIVFAYNKMGLAYDEIFLLKSSSDSKEAARQCYQIALDIYQRLYVFENGPLPENGELMFDPRWCNYCLTILMD